MIRRTNGFLEEYTDRALKGDILIGRELKKELERLRDDMDDPRYIYDTTEADRRIRFMEGCVRLTKSPFYGQPMELMLYQKAWISALYGFQMAEDGTNRFRRCILLQSRKNGKSELCSALALSELIIGPAGADVVCSSNDDNQANILYVAIDTMRLMIDPKQVDTWRNQQNMRNKITNSKVFKLSDRTRSKEGRNIDFAIVDEVHEMKDNIIVKPIEQSQSLKENPKLFEITTEGFVIDGYLDEELKKGRAIIKREDDSLSGKRFLPWLYTQDSEREIFTNERSWMKSNPTVGVIKKVDYLREQLDLAKQSKTDRIYVLTKDFNIKQNGVASWLNLEDYDYKATYDIEDYRGAFCIGHVDLAETTDLCCAKAIVMLPHDPVKYIVTKYFIPTSKLDPGNDDHNAGAHYKEWADAGYIEVCEGNDIDLTVVADFFYKLQKNYGIKLYKCGYDQKFAKDWLKRMEMYGWTKEYGDVEMVLQDAKTLNNAINLVEADLKARLINYNENPVDKWCFENASLKVNDQRQALVIKTEDAKKIDGTVTLVSAYEMLRRYRSDFRKITGGA